MKKVDFSNGKIAQNIFQTAFPLLCAQIVSLLYNIIDRIYIGRIEGIGTDALGAVGLCFPLIMIVGAVTNLFGIGGAPLFSIELGRGDHEKAGVIFNTAFRLQVTAAIVLMLLFEPGSKLLLTLFGATADELVYSLPYIRIYLTGTLFSMISTGITPYINAQGFSVVGMRTVLAGAVTNIILDPIFIFVLKMGVAGAAVATVIAQALSAFLVMRFLLGPSNEYRLRRPSGGPLFPYAGKIAALGTTSCVMQMTNSLVAIVCNGMLMNLGGAAFVSVYTILSSIRQIMDTPIIAITEGSSPVISYNYGARRAAYVKRAMLIMGALSIGYTAIMWGVIELRPQRLLAIFTPDPELQQLALRPLHLYYLAFIFQAFQYTGQTVFKALNKTRQAIFFSLFRKVFLVTGLTLALPTLFRLGTDGVFLAEPISNVVGGIICFTTMLIMILPELKRMAEETAQLKH